MGKKRVAQKSGNVGVDEKIKEQASRTTSTSKKRIEEGFVYVNASYNNTMVTVTDSNGNVMAWSSAGSLGFSGPKKATPFAASKVVDAVIEKIKRSGPFNVHIIVRGIGSGRDSAVRTFAAQGFNILSLKDATPIPHNGPRPKKRRRV
jgi:small subunit ribosomal protein S11